MSMKKLLITEERWSRQGNMRQGVVTQAKGLFIDPVSWRFRPG